MNPPVKKHQAERRDLQNAMNPPAAMNEQQIRREKLMGQLSTKMNNNLWSTQPRKPIPLTKPVITALVDGNLSQTLGITSRDYAWITKNLEPIVIFFTVYGCGYFLKLLKPKNKFYYKKIKSFDHLRKEHATLKLIHDSISVLKKVRIKLSLLF